MSKRIQRKRTKGWRMPANTVYVGRPTKWGNPYKAGDNYSIRDDDGRKFYRVDAELAVMLYRAIEVDDKEDIKRQLSGKNLACWCPLNRPCHADVLLEIANTRDSEAVE